MEIQEAAARIRAGEIVAIPTDTVYGLAADPFQAAAVERLFRLKGRAEDKPILLLVDSRLQVERLASELPPAYHRLAARFWPGPVTMILPAAACVPQRITAASGTVAVRLPGLPLVRRLIRAAGVPLTGTSANRSGQPAARSAAEVRDQFPRARLAIFDGGRSASETPSTIVDLTGEPRVVREGAVPAGAVLSCLK